MAVETTPTRATAIVAGLFFSGVLSGAWVGAAASDRAHDPYAELDLFARVLTTIETDYVDEISAERLVEAAIHGMVDELDDHSRWLSAEEYAALRDETFGSYEGIGVEVRKVEGGVLVTRVIEGGPAKRDGLLAGDRILEVDGHPMAEIDLYEVSSFLKGPRGTPVVLTIERPGTPGRLQITTVRDRIVAPSVESDLLPENIGYVHLFGFQDGCAAEVGAAIGALEAEAPIEGLVLDLRDNPGGLLDEAVLVADLFLDEGPIVSTRGRVEGAVSHDATPGGVRRDLPVAVLVNGMSASGSEIVAGALQDTGRAKIVGTHTYGKGSVQIIYENRDESALKLTIGRYYTPSGQPVAPEEGRVPDVVVPMPILEDPMEAVRARIAAAGISEADRAEIESLLDALPDAEPEEQVVPWEGPIRERLAVDVQLQAAVSVLTGG